MKTESRIPISKLQKGIAYQRERTTYGCIAYALIYYTHTLCNAFQKVKDEKKEREGPSRANTVKLRTKTKYMEEGM